METLLQKADKYFENHLDRGEWLTFSDDERKAAVTMAGTQILCELGAEEINTEDIFQTAALCEQALFLAMNRKRRLPEDEKRFWVKSESVDGAGSRTFEKYETSGAEDGAWSPAARIFLQRAGNRNIRIGRG